MSIIKVKNLSVSFDNKPIFKNLKFNIDKGDYFCIVGENGSGKTTLMKSILGLPIKYTGSIEFNGITGRSIGWLPQRSETKRDFPASALEIVLSGFAGKQKFGLFYTAAQKKIARENMLKMEIADIAQKSFSALSGGQQQRVLLCRALTAAEKVLLLDEPVTGLDTSAENEMYEILKKLNDEGITVIMITHDVKKAASVANKILHIANNEYFFGSCEEYKKTDFYKNITGGK